MESQEITPTVPAVNPLPPEEQLNDLRRRVLSNEPLSVEEYAQVIASMRQRRVGDTALAVEKKAAKVSKAAASTPPVSLDDLFKSVGL